MATQGTPPENRKTQRSWKDVARELSQEEDCAKPRALHLQITAKLAASRFRSRPGTDWPP